MQDLISSIDKHIPPSSAANGFIKCAFNLLAALGSLQRVQNLQLIMGSRKLLNQEIRDFIYIFTPTSWINNFEDKFEKLSSSHLFEIIAAKINMKPQQLLGLIGFIEKKPTKTSFVSFFSGLLIHSANDSISEGNLNKAKTIAEDFVMDSITGNLSAAGKKYTSLEDAIKKSLQQEIHVEMFSKSRIQALINMISMSGQESIETFSEVCSQFSDVFSLNNDYFKVLIMLLLGRKTEESIKGFLQKFEIPIDEKMLGTVISGVLEVCRSSFSSHFEHIAKQIGSFSGILPPILKFIQNPNGDVAEEILDKVIVVYKLIDVRL